MKKIVKRLLSYGLSLMPIQFRQKLFNILQPSLLEIPVKYDVFSTLTRLRELQFNPAIVIDVGAHEGLWSSKVAEIFPDATYKLFEPLYSKKLSIENVMRGTAFELYSVLLSGKSGQMVTFYEMETGSSIYAENSRISRTTSERSTEILDDFFISNSEVPILLKIDVQGAEIDVLKGARNVLEHVEIIIIEISFLQYNKNAPYAHEVISFLAERSFYLFDVVGFNRKLQDHALVQADAIFIRDTSSIRRITNDFSKPFNLYSHH